MRFNDLTDPDIKALKEKCDAQKKSDRPAEEEAVREKHDD